MSTWTAKFPHPGEQPPEPPDERPPVSDKAAWDAWWKIRDVFNDYIKAGRKHMVAVAVDELLAKDGSEAAAPADRIALMLGLEFLNPGDKPTGIFGLF